eukprot:6394457-Pyramimonas_sp.AAC.1
MRANDQRLRRYTKLDAMQTEAGAPQTCKQLFADTSPGTHNPLRQIIDPDPGGHVFKSNRNAVKNKQHQTPGKSGP